jgi:hypothetical protein
MNNDLVQAGWNFVSSLANITIVILLIVIGISTIFNIGRFKASKLLPKLIIAALLVNFSLLIVGGLIDISGMFYNTLIKGNETIITTVTNKMQVDLLGETLIALGASLLIMVGAFAIPFVAPVAQTFIPIAFLTAGGIFHEQIAIMVLQVICAYLLSAIFFSLGVLFLMRVFIIQLLAILSPLAVVSAVFSKKYWEEWSTTLLEWTILGIPLLLFIILGIKSSQGIINLGSTDAGTSAYITDDSKKVFFYYFSLAIFLIIALAFSKMQTPKFAKQIKDGAISVGKMAWGMGLKPLGKALGRTATDFSLDQKQREEKYDGKAKGFRYRMHQAGNALGKGVRKAHTIAGTSPEKEKEIRATERREYLKKRFKDPKHMTKGGLLTDEALAARVSYASDEKGKDGIDQFSKEQIEKALKHYIKISDKKSLFALSENVPKSLSVISDYNSSFEEELNILKKDLEKAKKEKNKNLEKDIKEKIRVVNNQISKLKRIDPETLLKNNETTLKGTSLNAIDREQLGKMNNLIKGVTAVRKDLSYNIVKKDDKDFDVLKKAGFNKKELFSLVLGKKLISQIKKVNIEKYDKETLNDSTFKKNLALFANNSQLNTAIERGGVNYGIDGIQKTIEEIGIEKVVKINAPIIAAPYTPSGSMVYKQWEVIPSFNGIGPPPPPKTIENMQQAREWISKNR